MAIAVGGFADFALFDLDRTAFYYNTGAFATGDPVAAASGADACAILTVAIADGTGVDCNASLRHIKNIICRGACRIRRNAEIKLPK